MKNFVVELSKPHGEKTLIGTNQIADLQLSKKEI